MNLGFTIRGMDLAIAAGKPQQNRAFSDEKRRFQ